MGRLHDGSRNSHRGAVAPFLDHRPHTVITPCIYIAATFCHDFRSVSTMLIRCTNCARIQPFSSLGLALERKQIPRFVGNVAAALSSSLENRAAVCLAS